MTSTTPRVWTSGAHRRRRRHRLATLLVIGGLVAGATATTAVATEPPPWLQKLTGPPPVEDGSRLPSEIAVPVAPVGDGAPVLEAPVPGPAPVTPETAPEPEPVPGSEPALEPEPAPGPEPAPASDPVEEPVDADAETLDVVAVQERLRELGYLVGPADGRLGQQTTAAVMAFQQVHGLAVDGVVGPVTLAAFEGASDTPTLRGGPPTRIEVDLDRQLLHVVEGGVRVATLKVSSGSGETYRTASGGTAVARTPIGDFVVERRIHGVRQAPLGTLYDPLYFHQGFAIHGSTSVPAGPASKGCIRITIADARWLIERIPDGTPVQLHGGVHVFVPSA